MTEEGAVLLDAADVLADCVVQLVAAKHKVITLMILPAD